MWSFTIKIFFNKINNYLKKRKAFRLFQSKCDNGLHKDYKYIYTFLSISASNPCRSQLGNEEAEEPNVNVHSSAKNIWLGSK